ncbi:hypothetical protein ACOMHN_034323 [Nucella lapillus]
METAAVSREADNGAEANGSKASGHITNGRLFTWGLGKSGQLGTGKEQTEHTPQHIKLSMGGGGGGPSKVVSPVQVLCGGLYTAALTQDGDMFVTGCGKYGRLASGNEDNTLSFVKVALPEKVKQVSCGLWHGAAVAVSGGLLVWGHRKGCSTTENSQSSAAQSITLTPPSLLLLSPKIAGVSCGHNFTLAWTEEGGKVMTWGSGHHGVLGHGSKDDIASPRPVKALSEKVIVHASAGYSHSAFVTADGKLFTCGKGKDGALGLGKGRLDDTTTPEMVTFLPDEVQVTQVSCSVGEHHGHTLALTSEGRAYSWGDGYKGKLGLDSQESCFTPTLISQSHFDDERISNVCAGGIHSAAATSAGGVFTWGCGSDGRMGHPEGQGHRYLFRSDVPKRVEALASKGKRAVVSCSYYHTAAIIG